MQYADALLADGGDTRRRRVGAPRGCETCKTRSVLTGQWAIPRARGARVRRRAVLTDRCDAMAIVAELEDALEKWREAPRSRLPHAYAPSMPRMERRGYEPRIAQRRRRRRVVERHKRELTRLRRDCLLEA